MCFRSVSLVLTSAFLCVPVLGGEAEKRDRRTGPAVDGASLVSRAVLTTEELDAVTFESVYSPGKEGIDRPPPKELEGMAVGVWLAGRDYRDGEPIPALFAVRNSGAARGLDMKLDFLSGDAPVYNGARIHLRRADDPTWGPQVLHVYSCGSGPLMTIDRGGYYCVRGDLRTLNRGRLLPGEYVLHWSYTGLKSNAVRFTVRPARDTAATTPLAGALCSLIELGGGKRDALGQHSLHLTGARPDRHYPSRVGAHFAAGVAGKYYPSLRDLPVHDGGVEASARLIHRGKAAVPSAVEVTLRPTQYRKGLCLDRDFRIALLVGRLPGTPAVADRGPLGEPGKKGMARHSEPLPLDRAVVVRVDLPEDWVREARAVGPVRVAVVLSSERLERPGGRAIKELQVLRRDPGEVWRGVLRTPWLDAVLPTPPGPVKPETGPAGEVRK